MNRSAWRQPLQEAVTRHQQEKFALLAFRGPVKDSYCRNKQELQRTQVSFCIVALPMPVLHETLTGTFFERALQSRVEKNVSPEPLFCWSFLDAILALPMSVIHGTLTGTF